MIVAKNLSKHYGDFTALDDVSFTIKEGESVALWGTNGAGKTTIIKALLGLLDYEGQLTLNGIRVGDDGKAVRGSVGYVPQEAAFYDMSVKETVKFYARLKKAPAGKVEEAIALARLEEHSKKSVNALSGGMKQRLALAMSLLADPPILLLDEPTANLDTHARFDFLMLVKSLHQAGKTVVFASHRIDEVEALADRVIVLQDGKMLFECAPAELAEKLDLGRWLRIVVADNQHETAIALLTDEGFNPVPNGRAFYVPAQAGAKMTPLRLLENSQITVKDFDLVDKNALPLEGESHA